MCASVIYRIYVKKTLILNIFVIIHVHVSLRWWFPKCGALIKTFSTVCAVVRNARSWAYSRPTAESEVPAMGSAIRGTLKFKEP